MSASAKGVPYRRASRSPPASNLIALSLLHPASVDIAYLIASIETARLARIIRLKWCKDQKGARHQFLLLEVTRSTPNNLWIRLDRRSQRDRLVMAWVSSVSLASTSTADLCDDPRHLIEESQSKVKVETEFMDPPSLDKLGGLLTILESSFGPKTYPENAFFCSVIYENLSALGGGVDAKGPPSKAVMSIASDVRARIKKHMGTFQTTSSDPMISRESFRSQGLHDEPESMEGSITEHEDTILTREAADRIASVLPAIQVNSRNIFSQNIDLVPPWHSESRSDSAHAPTQTDLNEGVLHQQELRSHSLPNSSFNFSSASVQSNLFTHSWHRPSTMALTDLASYIDARSTACIVLLKWCKDLKGVPHEFLLLRVETHQPNRRALWLRLDRRSHRDATASQLISSTSASADTATVCDEIDESLFDNTRHQVKVETTFTTPPSLERLGVLLSSLTEESPQYKLLPENCFFFCSVVYENLVNLGGGVNNTGVPSKFSMSLAPAIREKIRNRSQTLPL